MISAVVFDADGVLFESVDIKTKAFASLFSRYPERLQAILQFHLNNGGMSRFEKFRIIYGEILKKPLPQKEFASLCQRFQELVFDSVLRCELVKGSLEFLMNYHNKYKFFIVSATPQDEIRKILIRKGLWHYFQAVYGSPIQKNAALRDILLQFNISHQDTVFVGDALGDYNAAVDTGIRFIGRLHKDNLEQFKFLEYKDTIRDLSELEQKIEAA